MAILNLKTFLNFANWHREQRKTVSNLQNSAGITCEWNGIKLNKRQTIYDNALEVKWNPMFNKLPI